MTSLVSADGAEVREELSRILRSHTFRERLPLQRLLEYLVQHTLDGTAGELKEYVVGIDVFGKPQGYDPQTDASTRVQIGKLRRKLEEYYLDEGLGDTLVLQLPKRSFAIVCESRTVELPLTIQHAAPPRRHIAWMRLLPWGMTIVFSVWALFVTMRATTNAQSVSPELAEIWQPFLQGSRPILISLGTHVFYQFSGGFVREPGLDRLSDTDRQSRVQDLQGLLHSVSPLIPYRGYTGVGQATAAFLLAKQFDRMNVPVDLARSSVLSWDDIVQHNVIFLGSAKSNSQILEIPVTWAFRIERDQIVNLRPKPGEAASYGPDCSLVSLFPGLHGRGEMLILESPTTTGVWAAARFLTDQEYAKELVVHLRRPDGRLPRYYQVVLKSQIAAGVPIRINYVAHRPL